MATVSDISLEVRKKIERPSSDRNFVQHVRDGFVLDLLQNSVSKTLAVWAKQFPKKSKVLDVGCGQQPYRRLIESFDYNYFSADIAQNSQNTVNFIINLEESLPDDLLADGPFDMILATEVIEHVQKLEYCFENFRKLLAPGGQLLVTCPFVFPLHEEPFDFWRPTPYALSELSNQAGFKILQLEKLGSSIDCLGLSLGHIINEFPFQTISSFWQWLGISLRQRVQLFLLRSFHWLIKRGFLIKANPKTDRFYLINFLLLTPEKP